MAFSKTQPISCHPENTDKYVNMISVKGPFFSKGKEGYCTNVSFDLRLIH